LKNLSCFKWLIFSFIYVWISNTGVKV
jgi:hypothetical protein